MFRRKAFGKLLGEKNSRKISILIGPRQVGKTTLLRQLYGEICVEGGERGVFLDVDMIGDLAKVESFETALNTMRLNGYEEKRQDFFYLFLDEAQRHPPLGRIMKNIYDHLPNVKIYASGSSPLALKGQAQESLAGRKIITYVYPLDFEEFLLIKRKGEIAKQLGNAVMMEGARLDAASAELHAMLEEYLVWGGYPEVALAEGEEAKRGALESIFDLYIKRDLVEYLKVGDTLSVKRLIEYLAINHGQKIEFSKAAAVCNLKSAKAQEYAEVLKETHIVLPVRPFFTNKNKEMVKMPKIYFLDCGVRNYFIKNFNPLRLRDDGGFLLEGFVLAELIKAGMDLDGAHFWQDKNRHEVDFVLDKGGLVAVEVKSTKSPKADDYYGLRYFRKEYGDAKRAYLVNFGHQSKEKECECVLPYSIGKLVMGER